MLWRKAKPKLNKVTPAELPLAAPPAPVSPVAADRLIRDPSEHSSEPLSEELSRLSANSDPMVATRHGTPKVVADEVVRLKTAEAQGEVRWTPKPSHTERAQRSVSIVAPPRRSRSLKTNPFTGSSEGLDTSIDALEAAMRGIEFFSSQVGEAAISVLAPHFALCTFEEPADKGALLRRGDDVSFAGVIVKGALTVKDEHNTPMYSLTKDDTLGEQLVAVNRQSQQQDDVYVRATGSLLVVSLESLEILNLQAPIEYQKLMDAFVARCIARSITEANYQPVTSSKACAPLGPLRTP